MPNYSGLKAIFDSEISNNDLPIEISAMMNYIVSSELNFNAFHSICAFLISNYTDSFLNSMGLNTVKLDLSKINQIPYNKMN